MRIRTSRTSGAWAEIKQSSNAEELAEIGAIEASRHLSQAVRSPNLVVLAGLGTSLCVTSNNTTLAPNMEQLRTRVKEKFEKLDAGGKLANNESRWVTFLRLARVSEDEPNLEHILSRAKVAVDFVGGEDGQLQASLLAIAEEVICGAVDFLTPATDLETHSSFLRRIARRPARKARVKLFTTNYDRCFEVAAGRSGFIVVDGFAFGSEAYFNPDQFNFDVVRRDAEERSDYVENLFHLLKMHGSIDWEQDDRTGRIVKREGTKKPILIYPRSTKYEMAFSQPYVDIMSSFQGVLRGSGTTLLVLGFGFNDKHIAEPILAAVRSNLSFNLVVVDPSLDTKANPDSELANSYLVNFARLADDGDGRIALIDGKFENVVPLIPDIVAQSDLERHQDRVRRTGVA